MNHTRATFFVLACLCCSLALAQTTKPSDSSDSVLPNRPDRSSPSGGNDLLGDEFDNPASGIAFRPPALWKQVKHPGTGGSEIARFDLEAKRYSVIVTRLNFNPPVEMSYHKEKNADGKGEHDVNGLFEETIDRLTTESPGIEFARKEIVQNNGIEVGMLAARVRAGTEESVTMIALIRALPTDSSKSRASRVYYSFSLNAPVPRDANLDDNAEVRKLAEMFNQMIDTVKLLDQSPIRQEQDERLFRTRSLFVNLTESNLRGLMMPEQWLRLQRDGKDVGYMYIVEESAHDLPRHGQPAPQGGGPDGVLIGVRTRTLPETGTMVDVESWEWCSFDRKAEKWTCITAAKSAEAAESYTEIGTMQTQVKLQRERGLEEGEQTKKGFDANQPAVRQVEISTLDVFYKGLKGKAHSAPSMNQTLPTWYLPQAVIQLLPRALAKYPGKTYMFAAYNNETHAVMVRYVDVDVEQAVDIGGRHVNAVPVRDRWGWEGAVTTHYVTKDGKYLGSVNKESKITILPTDRETIMKIWQNANLSRPKEVEEK